MAEEYDGSVVIDVDVDSKNFDKGTVDVEKAIKSLEATMTKAVEQMSKCISETLIETFRSLNTEIDQANKKVSKSSGGSKSKSNKYTDEYKNLADFVEQQEKNLAVLKEQQALYEDLGIPKELQHPYAGFKEKDSPLGDPSEYANIQEQIEHCEVELNQAGAAMQRLEESGRMFAQSLSQELANSARAVSSIDFTPLDLSRYEPSVHKYVIAVNKANFSYAQQANQLRQLEAQLALLRQKEQTPETEQKMAVITNKIEALKVKLQELRFRADEAQNALNNALSSPPNEPKSDKISGIIEHFKQLQLFSPTTKKIGSAVSKIARGFGKVGSAVTNAAKKLNIFNRGQNSANALAKKLVGRFTRLFTMLKSRIIGRFVSAILTGITDGIKGLAKVDTKFNEVISTLQSKFRQLSYTIVSSFAPLIKVVAPIISKITEYVTALVDKAAQLMAALTGQSTYQRANYNYTDYAKSLDDSAESTDDLANSTDGLADSTEKLNKQLAAYDELNVLSTTSDDDTSKSLLDNNKAKKDEPINTEPMYTEVPISFDMSNLSDRIKEAFAKGDFLDLGVELGEKLNEQIAKIDPTKIGSTIARVINSASSFVIGFLSTVNWGELTSKIVSNINTLIEEIDAEQLGHAFAEIINTIFEMGFTFATEFDWEEFGIKVADFINGVFENTDWTKVGQTINSFIIGFLDMLLSFLDNLNGDDIGESIGKAVKEIDFIGIATRLSKIIWGLLKLTWDILTGLWEGSGITGWWEEHLAEPLGRAIGKCISTVKETWRKIKKWWNDNIIEGWKTIGNCISVYIVEPIKDKIAQLKKDLEEGNWKQFFVDLLLSPLIGVLNGMLNSIEDFFNNKIGWLNSLGISELIGFEIPSIDFPELKVPQLATGTVVPANYGKFAAILGDNKREPEVVSPLSTMKQAMVEALAEVGLTGGNNDGDIVIVIDGREIFRATKKEAEKWKRTHGKPAFG